MARIRPRGVVGIGFLSASLAALGFVYAPTPATHAAVARSAGIIAQRTGAASDPTPGGYQLFQNAVIQQARLLACVDICRCLSV
jgi:hypothetical protein